MFDKVEITPVKDYEEGYTGLVTEFKSEIEKDVDGDKNRPERDFEEIIYLVDHDSRLSLSNDTWAELLLGSGMIVNGKKKTTVNRIKKWIKRTNFDEKLEDGVQNHYIKAGNMLFEKATLMSDVIEVDLKTIKGAERKGLKVLKYIQRANNEDNELSAEDIAHFKFSSRVGDVWGKPLSNSVIMPRIVDGRTRQSPVEDMWELENAMIKIFNSYASPMMMIHFKDAGEAFIKKTEKKIKKAGQGSKILTDKEFDAKVFEVNPASKFDKYIEHLEKDVMEAGSQFATQMLTAGFTARASSESASDVIKLKVKRKQNRLGSQIVQLILNPLIQTWKLDPEEEELEVSFQLESEEALSLQDVQGLFEKGTITRPEVRRHLDKKTNIEIDTNDMDDKPPITSVTPTNDLGQPQPTADQPMVTVPQESLEKLITIIAEKLPNPRGRLKEGRDKDDIDKLKMKVLEKLLNDPQGEGSI